ncbi:dipeptidase [Undibacterium baiyunense]|uniref:Membrane dipeptidase n=1 Tax=Undibacterium baiyunense TaxID=2828731 RepID=A0A941DH38_9BURK|nr:membrane dipeptidase [Undibacterium baiyunense]MBR7747841.1 membrane dipeptidase [Undibacterium baiyunense]
MRLKKRHQLPIALIISALCAGAVFTSSSYATPPAAKVSAEQALIEKAKGIHKRVLTLDTHADIDINNFAFSRNYSQDLENQVTLPKMISGGLDAAFFIVYTGQSTEADAFEPAGYKRAYDSAINMFEGIHRMTTVLAPNQIEFARSVADVKRIYAKGKKVALIGVENAYPLGDEKFAVKRVKQFYDRGARYMSLAHQGHSQLSDSNTGEAIGWKWNGLSPLGKEVIAEMNKWGIMVDVSHPSKESMMQTLAITKAPIIASHSSVRALCDVSRNMDDEQLLALKANNGVIQIVGFSSYLKTDSAERRAALKQVLSEFNVPGNVSVVGIRRGPVGGISEEQREALLKRLSEVDAKFPPPTRANVQDLVNHIDYAVKKIGLDHVGISSDFDGGGGIDGWNHAGETFNVTLELVRRGYTEEQIGKLWSGNLLRVMADVEKVAKDLQAKK